MEDLEDEVDYAKDIKIQLINYLQLSDDAGTCIFFNMSMIYAHNGGEGYYAKSNYEYYLSLIEPGEVIRHTFWSFLSNKIEEIH